MVLPLPPVMPVVRHQLKVPVGAVEDIVVCVQGLVVVAEATGMLVAPLPVSQAVLALLHLPVFPYLHLHLHQRHSRLPLLPR